MFGKDTRLEVSSPPVALTRNELETLSSRADMALWNVCIGLGRILVCREEFLLEACFGTLRLEPAVEYPLRSSLKQISLRRIVSLMFRLLLDGRRCFYLSTPKKLPIKHIAWG